MGIDSAIKQSKFKSGTQKAMVNIFYTNNWLRDIQQPVFKKYEILPQHYNILRIVNGKNPKPVSPGEIKDVILDKGRDLTRLVDKLVSLEYLERQLCSSNRRKMEITITKSGIKIMNDIENELMSLMKSCIKLNDEEAIQLSNLLDKLREG
jgi:DNA-binding MarR family transcriptional regulator